VDPTDHEDDTTLKYLGTVDDAWPVVPALDRITNERERLHDTTQVRNYLADRDEVAGVETLTDWFGLEDTLPVRAMRVRGAARAGDMTGALALCSGDFHPYATATLLLDCTAVLQQRRQRTPAKLGYLIRKALRALEKADPLPDFLGRKQDASVVYLRAEALARAGAIDRAIAAQNAATRLYEQSVEWLRILSMRPGGDPYFRDTYDDPEEDERDDNIAASILDADRRFASALVEGGRPDLAREVVLGMADAGGQLLDHHVHRTWTVGGATDRTRISIAARAAAETGLHDELQVLLNSARDRAATAAWIAERLTDTPAAVRWPWRCGDPVKIAIWLGANALGRQDTALITLAHLLITAPQAADAVSAQRWSALLRRLTDTGGQADR